MDENLISESIAWFKVPKQLLFFHNCEDYQISLGLLYDKKVSQCDKPKLIKFE